jgi:hypothetical protein
MAEIKTKATKESATKFLNTVTPDEKRKDSLELLQMFKKATGQKPVMWGTSIVGFGKFHYKSERSSQEGDWPLVGFSPRKQNLTLYILTWKENEAALKKLGKHKRGGGCLYIKRLSDVDGKVLTALIKKAYTSKKKAYTSK